MGDRSASLRIPSATTIVGRGYIEDRRPASDMDPYLVTAMIADTAILEESLATSDMLAHHAKWRDWKDSSHAHLE